MQFDPNNPVVKLCLQGMNMEEQDKSGEASRLFTQAWNEATNDFEKFLSAHFIARQQQNTPDKLKWLETALDFALKVNDDGANSALPTLYSGIAKCHENLGDLYNAKQNHDLAISARDNPSDKGPFYHGTRADIQTGCLLTPGHMSNYKAELQMNHIYFTALVNGAGLAAALAKGEGHERVYVVEPTGIFENDPNVTDKKFPGNPTRSYRTTGPLKVIGEITDWVRQTPEDIQKWKERLANSTGEIIN